jgi:SET domain-containing protein
MTYRSKSNIISERDRIRGILAQKEKEIKELQEVLNEYNFALIG